VTVNRNFGRFLNGPIGYNQPAAGVAPFFYVPQGTGLEPPATAPAAPDAMEAWQRLWNRIPGSFGLRAQALFQLQRSGISNPDLVIPRWGIVSDLVAAGPGAINLTFNFDTLTVVEGARLFLASGADPFDFSVFVRAGSDGGYILGTDRNPVPAVALWTANGDTVPIVAAPSVGRPNNQWSGAVVGVPAVPPARCVVAWYGVTLWTPDGQIQ